MNVIETLKNIDRKTYIYIGVAIVVIVAAVLVIRRVRKKSEAEEGVKELEKTIETSNLTFEASQYSTFADNLESCLSDKGISAGLLGVNQKGVYEVFGKMKTDDDVKQLIGAIVLVVVVVVIIFIRNRKKLKVKTDDSNNTEIYSEDKNEVLTASAEFPLRPKSLVGEYSATKGSYGKEIVMLQMIHNKMCDGCTQLTVDGKYGDKTKAELKKYFTGCVADDGTIKKEGYETILGMFKDGNYGTITLSVKD